MIRVDLITGFLGSGKTTFLKEYAGFLISRGHRVGIIENDYGAVNVDMMLLKDIIGENCGLEMISGGCDMDCHIRRFKTKLITMKMSGYDHVIIEPSGIYDVDEFFDVLRDEPLDEWYEIGNVITVVDAGLCDYISPDSDYVLASEAAFSGSVILSHMDEAGEDKARKTIDYLNNALCGIKCSRVIGDEVIKRSKEGLSDEELLRIYDGRYSLWDYVKMDISDSNLYNSVFIMNVSITPELLKEKVKEIFNDPDCGMVYRIKGFIRNDKGGYISINATRERISLSGIDDGQEIIIVIGEKLNEMNIKEYLQNEGVFTIAQKRPVRDELTISRDAGLGTKNKVSYFALGKKTNISREKYDQTVIYIGAYGTAEFLVGDKPDKKIIGADELIIVPGGTLCGVDTDDGVIYTEIITEKEINMNNLVKAGEVMKLKDLIQYEEGSISNLDVAGNSSMKFVLMAFDEGCALSPHRAPGNAIVFALDGEATIGYEGKDYKIKAGENFKFDKNGLHSVKADTKFKMALLLVLE